MKNATAGNLALTLPVIVNPHRFTKGMRFPIIGCSSKGRNKNCVHVYVCVGGGSL